MRLVVFLRRVWFPCPAPDSPTAVSLNPCIWSFSCVESGPSLTDGCITFDPCVWSPPDPRPPTGVSLPAFGVAFDCAFLALLPSLAGGCITPLRLVVLLHRLRFPCCPSLAGGAIAPLSTAVGHRVDHHITPLRLVVLLHRLRFSCCPHSLAAVSYLAVGRFVASIAVSLPSCPSLADGCHRGPLNSWGPSRVWRFARPS